MVNIALFGFLYLKVCSGQTFDEFDHAFLLHGIRQTAEVSDNIGNRIYEKDWR